MQNRKKRSVSAFSLGVTLIGAALQAGGLLKGNRIVFPDLPEIGQALIRLLENNATYKKIGITMLHVLESLLISSFAGILIGIAEGFSEWVHSFFRPVMILIRSMPMIVLVILTMSILNYKMVPVAAGCMILIPLFSEAVYEGCCSLDSELIDVYRLNGGFSPQVAVYVYLPLISGYLRQAFINAAGMGLKICVSAEYLVQTKDSLGKAVYSSAYFSEYGEIYAYALLMILLVFLITVIPEKLYEYCKRHQGN